MTCSFHLILKYIVLNIYIIRAKFKCSKFTYTVSVKDFKNKYFLLLHVTDCSRISDKSTRFFRVHCINNKMSKNLSICLSLN